MTPFELAEVGHSRGMSTACARREDVHAFLEALTLQGLRAISSLPVHPLALDVAVKSMLPSTATKAILLHVMAKKLGAGECDSFAPLRCTRETQFTLFPSFAFGIHQTITGRPAARVLRSICRLSSESPSAHALPHHALIPLAK